MILTIIFGFFVCYKLQKLPNDKYDIHPLFNFLGFVIGLPLCMGAIFVIQFSYRISFLESNSRLLVSSPFVPNLRQTIAPLPLLTIRQ
jgi:hypothetical protein